MEAAELTKAQSLAGALVIALLLAALHLLAPRIRTLPGVPERAMGSFAGGLAVAYVFLHLLPELVEGNEAIGEVLEDVVEATPLLDLAIFGVALAGFTIFYGLERRAERVGEDGPAVFRLHLGSFVVYNALIAGPGDLVLKPRGVAHAFWNATDEPARFLEIISSAGFERYFAEAAGMFASGEPDMEAFAALCERSGLDMRFESVPDLVARHGLEPPPEADLAGSA